MTSTPKRCGINVCRIDLKTFGSTNLFDRIVNEWPGRNWKIDDVVTSASNRMQFVSSNGPTKNEWDHEWDAQKRLARIVGYELPKWSIDLLQFIPQERATPIIAVEPSFGRIIRINLEILWEVPVARDTESAGTR